MASDQHVLLKSLANMDEDEEIAYVDANDKFSTLCAAYYNGQYAMVVAFGSSSDNEVERLCNLMQATEGKSRCIQCLGKFRNSMNNISLVLDFSFNVRLLDLISVVGASSLSKNLRLRIIYDTFSCLESMHESGIFHGNVTSKSVLLNFGLRAKLFYGFSSGVIASEADKSKDMRGLLKILEELGFTWERQPQAPREQAPRISRGAGHFDLIRGALPVSIQAFLKPGGKANAVSEQCRRHARELARIDLDMEVERINVAYLWTGSNAREESSHSQVRKLFLEQSELITKGPASFLRSLFLGIKHVEGVQFEGDGSLNLAEEHIIDACSEMKRQGISGRITAVTDFYRALVQLKRGQLDSKKSMFLLANKGNPFAQVHICQAFASEPIFRRHSNMEFNELSLFLKFAKTGYGVAEALYPLYYFLLSDEQKYLAREMVSMASLAESADRSAESGNELGRIVSDYISKQVLLDLYPIQRGVYIGLRYFSKQFMEAKSWIGECEAERSFFRLRKDPSNDEAVNWLSSIIQPEQPSIFLRMVWDEVLHAKLFLGLAQFHLDEDFVLQSMELDNEECLKDILAFSKTSGLGYEFMDRVQERYLSTNGLRILAGIYRESGQEDKAFSCHAYSCYVAAAEKEESREAMLDLALVFLEKGNKSRAEVWSGKAGFPANVIIDGLRALQECRKEEAKYYFQLAAEGGDARAMWFLGELTNSIKWYKGAAEFGFYKGSESLALYYKHKGDEKRYCWYLRDMAIQKMGRRYSGCVAASDAALVNAFQRWWKDIDISTGPEDDIDWMADSEEELCEGEASEG